MGGIQLHGGRAVLTLPHPAAVAAWSEDEALSALRAYEVAAAGLAELSAAVAGDLARRRRAAAVREVGPDASRHVRERAASEAEAAVVDEIRLASGLGVVDARARVELGRRSTLRTGTIRSALASGGCSWLMARTWQDATSGLDPHDADQIARSCTRPTRDGTVLSMTTFRGRLNRQLARHRTAGAQRDFDLDRRDARATITPHGTGEIIVSGAAERITAAMGRVDDLARAVRARGDGRTLAQLRSDIMLDLVLFGDIPALTHPAPPHTQPDDRGRAADGDGPGGWSQAGHGLGDADGGRDAGGAGDAGGGSGASGAPIPAMVPGAGSPQWVSYLPGGLPPATIWVVIPASALLDLSDEPGRMADGSSLPAHVVRDLAFAAGTTWRRLVTDPITGEAIELSTTSYTPPPRLREAIQARDGTCRAPGSTLPATRCDLDHDIPWPAGPTCAENLAAKSRRAHLHKTRGQWATRQAPDGTIVWTTGTGRQYTTYPMQYDETAPGRATTAAAACTEPDTTEPDTIEPDTTEPATGAADNTAADNTARATSAPGTSASASASTSATDARTGDRLQRGGAGGGEPDQRRLLPDLSEESPIDHRPQGATPTTRPAKRQPGRRPAPRQPRTADPTVTTASATTTATTTAATTTTFPARPDPGPPPF